MSIFKKASPAPIQRSAIAFEGLGEDNTGKPCSQCGKGSYKETSQQDDYDGTLHCTNCGHEVRRWAVEDIPKNNPNIDG